MNPKLINAAFQVLPTSNEVHPYKIVDKAIELIDKTGLKYKVCPFETVVEGTMEDILKLANDLHEICYNSGAESMMMYLKIQTRKDSDVFIDDKMKKYK